MRPTIMAHALRVNLLGDSEFRARWERVPEAGRRLFLWLLEQKAMEEKIYKDDDLSRNQMRKKIAICRKRPVQALSELEQNAFHEWEQNGRLSAATIQAIANAALDAYFDRPDLSKLRKARL